MTNADILELTSLGGGHTRTVRVKRGPLKWLPGTCPVAFDDEQAARTYVAFALLGAVAIHRPRGRRAARRNGQTSPYPSSA